MDNDTALLCRFADEGAQEAFSEFVRRKVDLVYAAALRQTGAKRRHLPPPSERSDGFAKPAVDFV